MSEFLKVRIFPSYLQIRIYSRKNLFPSEFLLRFFHDRISSSPKLFTTILITINFLVLLSYRIVLETPLSKFSFENLFPTIVKNSFDIKGNHSSILGSCSCKSSGDTAFKLKNRRKINRQKWSRLLMDVVFQKMIYFILNSLCRTCRTIFKIWKHVSNAIYGVDWKNMVCSSCGTFLPEIEKKLLWVEKTPPMLMRRCRCIMKERNMTEANEAQFETLGKKPWLESHSFENIIV